MNVLKSTARRPKLSLSRISLTEEFLKGVIREVREYRLLLIEQIEGKHMPWIIMCEGRERPLQQRMLDLS